MTKNEAIVEACKIMALAYHSIGDYSEPSDGFCSECPAAKHSEWNFQSTSKIYDYIRLAVVEKLKADGFTIDERFSAETGKMIEP